MSAQDTVRDEVRDRYARAALTLTDVSASSRPAASGADACGLDGSCCSPGALEDSDVFGAALYTNNESSELPEAAVLASFGCGNPTAVADLREGEAVLDLGSGGGIDVLLSARRVGATGFTNVTVEVTHEVANQMHGAIVKAIKL